MFEKCIIKQVIKECHTRGYPLMTMQRYLRVRYSLNIERKALSNRFWRMYMSGQLPILKSNIKY
jgi:hypothetical protein